jgi:mono/diheme cytochrome c family protein
MKKWIIFLSGLLLALAFSAVQAQEPSGPDLVKRLGCLGCHTLDGQGRNRGPSWDGLGNRMTSEAIKKQMVSPQGKMPNFAHLKPEELNALVQYLSGLK